MHSKQIFFFRSFTLQSGLFFYTSHNNHTAFSMSKIIQSGKYVLHSIIFFSMCSIAKVTMLHRFTTHAFSSIDFICMAFELKEKNQIVIGVWYMLTRYMWYYTCNKMHCFLFMRLFDLEFFKNRFCCFYIELFSIAYTHNARHICIALIFEEMCASLPLLVGIK